MCGFPAAVAGLSLLLIGIGGIIGTLLVGMLSSRSMPSALVVSPGLVGVGLVVLIFGGRSLASFDHCDLDLGHRYLRDRRGLSAGAAADGDRAPESATSIGVLLTQLGFAFGASVGGVTIQLTGVGAVPFVALAFVLASVAIALTLRRAVHDAQAAALTASA